MIILAILGTLGAIAWTVIVFGANVMSDDVTGGFQGALSLGGAWLISAALWAAWWFK
jgi:hypothetical protein